MWCALCQIQTSSALFQQFPNFPITLLWVPCVAPSFHFNLNYFILELGGKIITLVQDLHFFFFFLSSSFYSFFYFLALQYCIGFAIYQHESATGIQVFPILNPLPSPYHPSGSSQCTSPKHPVSCIEPGLATRFIYDIIHVSVPFSQIIPPSPSLTESKRLFALLYITTVSHELLLHKVFKTMLYHLFPIALILPLRWFKKNQNIGMCNSFRIQKTPFSTIVLHPRLLPFCILSILWT